MSALCQNPPVHEMVIETKPFRMRPAEYAKLNLRRYAPLYLAYCAVVFGVLALAVPDSFPVLPITGAAATALVLVYTAFRVAGKSLDSSTEYRYRFTREGLETVDSRGNKGRLVWDSVRRWSIAGEFLLLHVKPKLLVMMPLGAIEPEQRTDLEVLLRDCVGNGPSLKRRPA